VAIKVGSLDHLEKLKKFVLLTQKSRDFHAVILEGPAGWSKTTTVHEALASLNVKPAVLGSYSTPLHLFNFLATNNDRVILIDDSCVFASQAAMAILKSATWGNENNERIVSWGSTSQKALLSEFKFTGKLIIISNQFPNSIDGQAVRSRAVAQKMDLSRKEAMLFLRTAACNQKRFKNKEIAAKVAAHLSKRLENLSTDKINLRTLKLGYELCEADPENWKSLIDGLLPKEELTNVDLIKRLSKSGLAVKEQFSEFERKTGLKRRQFFYVRKSLGLSTQYN